jgi:hypothetical protein
MCNAIFYACFRYVAVIIEKFCVVSQKRTEAPGSGSYIESKRELPAKIDANAGSE